MLFEQMKYFITVVDYNSFTEAAQQNLISQSAISQQIQALEKSLGIALLMRRGRQFTLTPAGEYFYQHGKVLLDEIEEFKEETIRRGENNEMHMTIGYPKNFDVRELSKTILTFMEEYPEVHISIVSEAYDALSELLASKEADIIISEQREIYDEEAYHYEVGTGKCYIEVSAKDPLSKKDFITVEDLKDIPCILIVSKGKEEVERAFYEKFLGISHRFLYADSLEQARLMVLSNKGYLLIDEIGKLPIIGIGIKRVRLYQDEEPVQRKYVVSWNKEETSEYIEIFVEALRELLHESSMV